MREAGPAALSLAAHGVLALLLVLAFGQLRPLAGSAARSLPAIVLGLELPKPALAPAPAPPPARPRPARHVARGAAPVPAAQTPVATAGDTQLAPPQPPAAVEESVAAAPAEPAAAAAGAAAEAPPLLYLAEVSRLIRLRLDYPEQARLDRARGTALVHILLARDGTVLSVELLRGAGHPALDAEAREVVLRIHKFPELPDYYARGEQRFAIDQPIGFVGG
jgi:TonB family protein